ncbi:response regulator [Acidaminobacter sp. JC074]|uniref:response regulator transcription factor n=1 Tax=Acidaminobacter sp. JC074 TaxID=2530199 RepID=UPI001F0F7130|nr:response regulator [Acidaminobacter sp. JC074]MCH4889391.1 response regulator [Acidaminobacter sp. JC074]
MYKVLIVDDEKIVRLALKNMIEFESLDLELVGEACEGSEAISIVESQHIDLVITDLMMPVMSGLDLIDSLNKMKYNGKILVLSNHDDFDLVRQALKSGASDYLLKGTMEQKEFKSVIKKICETLDQEKKDLEISKQEVQEILRGKKLFREKILKSILLDKDFNDIKLKEYIETYDFKLSLGTNQVFLIQVDSLLDAIDKKIISDIQQMTFTIKSIILETTRNRFEGEIIDLTSNEYVLIAPSNTVKFPENLAVKIVKKLNMYINQTVSVILHKSFGNSLYNDIRMMKNYSVYKFYLGENSVLDLSELTVSKDTMIAYEQLLMDVKGYVYKSDYGQVYELICNLIEEAESKGTSPEVAKNAVVILLKHIIKTRNIKVTEKIKQRLDELKSCRFKDDFLLQTDRVLDEIKNEKVLKNNKDRIMEKIEHYVMSHLQEKITLNDLSAYVHLNPSYLSRFFKQTKGVSLIEYINSLKINQAKYLLLNKDLSIEEIGREIGIEDPYYFNKVFKKAEGMSPSSYRKSRK